MAGPSKRVRYGDKDFDETALKWLEEVDDDASDIGSASENENIESEHDSATEVSEEDSPDYSDVDENVVEHGESSTSKNYLYGKNGYRWCTTEVVPSSRVRKHNIVLKVPVLKGSARDLGQTADPFSIWNLLFPEDILVQIVEWTNHKLFQVRSNYTQKYHVSDVDMIELKAFLGLLIYTSIFNSNHENMDTIFATDGTGRDIFRAVMSKNRFSVLLSALRFDDPRTRTERKKEDPTAAISQVFHKFIENCQNIYGMGDSVTIDEMLVSFRGRTHFKMYMPNKPCKYGIKIMCLTDSSTSYLYNAYIYSGKGSDGLGLSEEEHKFSKPTQAVIRLAKPLFGSNRNVTADNWFSSIELVDILLRNKLTYVGTVKKNKREIPSEFLPNKKRAVGSSLYGFRDEKTMVSYVGKKGKATILVSSMHSGASTDPDTQKPDIIMYYNRNKGGVDTIDEKCAKSSSSRRTCRWPLAIFFRILDISIVNSYILHQCYTRNSVIREKSVFAKQLAAQLVRQHMERRLTNPRVSREVRSSISRILGIPEIIA